MKEFFEFSESVWVKQWRQRKTDGGRSVGAIRWLEAEVETRIREPIYPAQKASSEGLLVELTGGRRLWIGNSEQVRLAAELIELLEQGGQRGC